mmetsp:Transcript_7679/g.15545  ORF Transcript_7679/g.15545 Transcript_7679/m.15545 type:complete len:87 (-) Transcript_7679:347-607(-)
MVSGVSSDPSISEISFDVQLSCTNQDYHRHRRLSFSSSLWSHLLSKWNVRQSSQEPMEKQDHDIIGPGQHFHLKTATKAEQLTSLP